ncbi:uncharacterized protein LOC116289940 [Actinia tenebrosa]|uniref:Uncharacterized protein LOC116289940 n=1 Tax=Actinia tenebrosa TaxID=6105 RepID=A0A6P8HJH7_ACTTE|nr:uncharacterized protein LOC116289940 [Actinia tenebrosa]
MTMKKVLFHYTNEKGAEAINEEQVIKASTKANDDAAFGEGTYFTSKNPIDHSKEQIRRNNYDDGPSYYNSKQFEDKTDYVVAVSLGEDEFNKVDGTKRDIYVAPGDVDLTTHDHLILKNK